MIRLNYFMRKPENMSLEDFQQHWLDKHAALVVKNTPALRIRRYVQAHTLADDADGELMCQMYSATAQPYDGVAEFWWKSRQDLAEALQTPEGQQAAAELLEDERGFVDFSKSLLYFCVEIPQINPPGRIVAREDNMLIKGYYVGHARPGLSVTRISNFTGGHATGLWRGNMSSLSPTGVTCSCTVLKIRSPTSGGSPATG
jgi:uncharacterized protein (TIGR02118 family)